MSTTKKIIVGALAIMLVAALSIGGSLAFLTDSEERTNVFAVGDLDITLEEPNWDEDSGQSLYPGITLPKDPVISEIENDSYMRVYVKVIDKNEMMPNPDYVDETTTPGVAKEIANTNKGKVITDTDRLDLIYKTIYYDKNFNQDDGTGTVDCDVMYSLAAVGALSGVSNGVNSDDFTHDTAHSTTGSECYTYNGIFNEGDEVILFTNIVVPTDWNQTQMADLGKYDIVIYAQAIQSSGFEDAAAAFTALDGEVTAGTIQKNHGEIGA